MSLLNKTLYLIFAVVICVYSQQKVGEWRTYTDMKSVNDAVLVGTEIWAATSGGIFVFDTLKNTFKKFTNADGLSTNDLKTILFDGTKRIWVGNFGGWVNIYDLQTKQWFTIKDIAEANYSNRNIQTFYFKGDTVFIVSEFGVSVFKTSVWKFQDTYNSQNFGFSSAPKITSMILWRDSIWIGTEAGLVVSALSNPYYWKRYESLGLMSKFITKLAIFNDTLLIGTEKGMAFYKNGTFNAITGSFDGYAILDLKVARNLLYILSNFGSTTISIKSSVIGDAQSTISNSEIQAKSIIPVAPIWLSSTNKGLVKADNWKYFYPNGPASNMFISIAVDENGVLWVAPGTNSSAGFFRFDLSLPEDIQWKEFPRFGGGCYRVSVGSGGSIWISTWGDGVVEVVSDTIRRKLNYYSKPSLPGAKANIPTYVVTGGVAIDEEGKTWISNRVEDNGRSLLRLDDDTTASFFSNRYNSLDGWFHSLMIDPNGTKWLAGDLPWETPGRGIYVFNEKMALKGIQTINGWAKITTSDGLNSNVVYSFAVDLDGAVWVGTNEGINIVFNPEYPKQFTLCYALQAYRVAVQTIAVDALNNKWVGTKEGVFVVNSDGTQLLQSYNSRSTAGKLLSDDVKSISIDQTRGIVYFGTDKGLSSLGIEAIKTVNSYSELIIGPNPFVLPNNQQLTIGNLTAGSYIKIMDVSGKIVKQFEAQGGGRAFWDGKDSRNELVSSGIYFIIAYAENGGKNVVGKVAVIRR